MFLIDASLTLISKVFVCISIYHLVELTDEKFIGWQLFNNRLTHWPVNRMFSFFLQLFHWNIRSNIKTNINEKAINNNKKI